MSRELDRLLAELKSETAGLEPSAEVDAAIGGAIARKRAPVQLTSRGPKMTTPVRIAWFAALAATLAFVAIFQRTEAPVPAPMLDAGTMSTSNRDSGWFLPIVPISELAETGDAMVVSARLSRMTLAQFGLPVNPAQASDAIDTELLVRNDGAVLAVRFSNGIL